MADRDGERVGGVMRRRIDLEPEDGANHPLHLRLVGPSVSAHGLLDGRWRILDARNVEIRAGDERDAARLADRQGGSRDSSIATVSGEYRSTSAVTSSKTRFSRS